MKRILYGLRLLILWVLWALLLFVQHVSCFDIFESNFLYLYLIAALSAVLHYGMLVLLRRHKWVLQLCCGCYCFLVAAKLFALYEMIRFENQIGLTLLCLCLDAAGVAAVLFLLREKKHETGT